ncbi:MAG: hypothetical protein ACTSX8_04890 [Alphaproteobacteria bacterium]
MSNENHPAFPAMVTAADGLLVSYRRDLEFHDREATSKFSSSECFVWIVGTSATHLVRASVGAEAQAIYREAFDPITGHSRSDSNCVHFWDGHDLQVMPHIGAFDALNRASERMAARNYVAPVCSGAVPLPRVPGE